ncbi:MAG: multidrug effflux MFS transporter [Pseudonocardiaceae bacterium]
MNATKPDTRAAAARLIVILGGLMAFGPITIDMYLPAMPQIATALDTGPSQVQLTLTACLIGLAAGQLVAGPLSDSIGRRRPLLIGLSIYTLVSLACALAPSIWAMTGLRLLQGFGAAAGIVISRAVVRDVYSGTALAKKFSTLILVFGVAPILAPLAGAQVLRFTDWRGIFLVFAVFGLLLLVVAALGLPETLPAQHRRAGSLTGLLRTSRRLLTDRLFVGYAASSGLAFAGMFAYISGSSFVLQGVHGLSPVQFSIVFGVNALGLIAVSQVNGRLVGRVSERRLLAIGLISAATGGLLLVVVAAGGFGLAGILTALFIAVASVGLVLPNGTALAMADHPDSAGMASALLGVVQFVIGGSAAPLVGLGGTDSVLPMAVVMACCGVLALGVFTALTRSRASVAVLEPVG